MESNQSSFEQIFDQGADTYAKKYMDVSLYVPMLSKFADRIKNPQAGILDLACGPANLSLWICQNNPRMKVTGIDFSDQMLQHARTFLPSGKFIHMDCRDVAKLDSTFDAVICGFLLPYLSPEETNQLFSDLHDITDDHAPLYLSCIASPKTSAYTVNKTSGNPLTFWNYNIEDIKSMLIKQRWLVMEASENHNPKAPEGMKDEWQAIAVKSKNISENEK